MTQEEKVRAYDEALSVALETYKTQPTYRDWLEKMFPELKESDDEKIRKALIEMVHDTTGDSLWVDYNVHKEDAIAWLEKQANHANFRNKIEVGDKVTRNRDGVLVNLSQLNRVAKVEEKQGEQKPTDVRTTGYWHVEDTEQNPAWSEEDEKVLHAIRNALNYEKPRNYLKSRDFEFTDILDWLKSLKDRVQPKQEWNEEDERMYRGLHNLIYSTPYCDSRKELSDWLKSLRPQSQWKPSEEQMIAISTAINILGKGTLNGKYLIELHEQLKKLKE